jgi:Protein of unknown function (DUF3455)
MPIKLAVPCLLLLSTVSGQAEAAETSPAGAPSAGVQLVGVAPAIEIAPAIQAPGEQPFMILHAEGAQVYECKAADGKLVWSFREPIATLFDHGKTVGRHYAGPNWEHQDGSAVTGKVTGTAAGPGTAEGDIPWLKLEVTSRRGSGALSEATTVQRILTHGGKLDGACEKAGAYRSVPYSADYVFLRKG